VRSTVVGRLTVAVCSSERCSRGREGKKASRRYLRAHHELAELRRCLPWLERRRDSKDGGGLGFRRNRARVGASRCGLRWRGF